MIDTACSNEQCTPTPIQAIGPDSAATVAATLKSLSDPLRLQMLSAIAADPRGESCVCDLAELADVSQPTVSHHLKILKHSGLVTSERRGTWVWYRLDEARRSAVTALLDGFAPAAVAAVGPGANETQTQGTAGGKPDRAEELQAMDTQVSRLAEDLAAEYPDVDLGLVTAVVRESFTGLVRTAAVVQHLIPCTATFARQRLDDITRSHRTAPPQVLFLCVANAGRSQLAAALVDRLSGGRVIARSAGSAPAAEVHPKVRSLLTEIAGASAAQAAFPRPITDDAVRAADVVVTMGCGDVCPIVPGVAYEDWAIGDPALASAQGTAAIRQEIEGRVRELLQRLLTD